MDQRRENLNTFTWAWRPTMVLHALKFDSLSDQFETETNFFFATIFTLALSLCTRLYISVCLSVCLFFCCVRNQSASSFVCYHKMYCCCVCVCCRLDFMSLRVLLQRFCTVQCYLAQLYNNLIQVRIFFHSRYN